MADTRDEAGKARDAALSKFLKKVVIVVGVLGLSVWAIDQGLHPSALQKEAPPLEGAKVSIRGRALLVIDNPQGANWDDVTVTLSATDDLSRPYTGQFSAFYRKPQLVVNLSDLVNRDGERFDVVRFAPRTVQLSVVVDHEPRQRVGTYTFR